MGFACTRYIETKKVEAAHFKKRHTVIGSVAVRNIDTKITALGTFLVLAGLSPVLADGSRPDSWSECRASKSCEIEYEQLSNQSSAPFLFLGRIMNETRPRWQDYRQSINQYSDVRFCLEESEQLREAPNLLKFDWEGISGRASTEVCLFRIMKSLNDVDRMENWFSYFGFSTQLSLKKNGSRNAKSNNYRVHSLSAGVSIERFRELSPSWLKTKTGFDPAYNYAVDLSFSSEMRLTHVSASENSK